MKDTIEITLSTTVNDAILARPVLLTVFEKYGIDSCCGGGLAIGEAARRHKVDPDELREALNAASI